MPNDNSDPWIAPDKLYHLIFCLSLTLFFSKLLTSFTAANSRRPFPFLRRHSILFSSSLSLLAGAAKEAADHLRIFPSSGASVKDAIADLLGVLIAALALSFRKKKAANDSGSASDSSQSRRVLPV